MITMIDPQMFEILGIKGIAALLFGPTILLMIAGLFFIPASAIPLYFLIFATIAGIVWAGSRGTDWMN